MMRTVLVAVGCLQAAVAMGAQSAADIDRRVERVLKATPLIDGHNDLPWAVRSNFHGSATEADLRRNAAGVPLPAGGALMTDMPRLRTGRVGGQFWSVWIPVAVKGFEAVQVTLEQIDVVKELARAYPDTLQMAYTAADVRRIHKAGRVASLVGIEGGHQINGSLAVLRQMYDAGARYMTLTHATNVEWADSATDMPANRGLTPFGREVIGEMNRIGMVVDLSHVSPASANAALDVSVAPVMFSHSSARALVDHPRNVDDETLRKVARNGGIVMVNFATGYISEERRQWNAARAAEQARYNSPPFGGLYIGDPERAKSALDAWEKEHPKPPATLAQVADHVEHIRRVAGVDHVGIGADFDGMPDAPQGLEGVDKYPALLAELMRRGWSDADIAKFAGENLLRVLAAVEAVSAKQRAPMPVHNAATTAISTR